MRILAITNLYPRPGHETIAAYNRQQFHALSKQHALRIIAPVAWTNCLRDFGKRHARPRRYVNADGIWVDHPVFYFPPRMLEHRYGEYYLQSIRKSVKACLKEFPAEAILSSWAHPDGWAAVHLARELGLPVVVKVVGSDLLVVTRNLRRRERVIATLLQADRVVTVSRHLADHAVRMGVDEKRIEVICEGVDHDLFFPGDQNDARQKLNIDPTKKMILFVGNLLLSKGAAVLIEACGELQRRCAERFQCYLVGGGRDEALLRKLVDSKGLARWVTLAGPRPHKELVDWYRACDVVALPSFSEGIPNVLREATVCGKPFVATSVGGIPEIVNASSRLVEPGDAGSLAGALLETLQQSPVVDVVAARRRNISWEESARQLARQFTVAPRTGAFRSAGLTETSAGNRKAN